MRLNNIAKEPFKIISFVLITLLFSYLIVGDVVTAVATSFISFWICLMPKLDYKNSLYKKKIPKFLRKNDLLNKILIFLIPTVLMVAYAITYAPKGIGKLTAIGAIGATLLLSFVNYGIAVNSKNDVDWITPYITSTITVVGIEVILGNGSNLFTHLFKNPSLDYLWAFLFQVMFIYSMFRIFSILLPGRTMATGVSSGIFVVFTFLSNLLIKQTGFTFKPAELLKIKDAVALTTVAIKGETEIWKTAGSSILLLAIIIAISFLLYNKKASVYDLMKRVKSCACGIVILLIAFFGIKLTSEFKEINVSPNENYGYIYSIVKNPMATNTYSGDFLDRINKQKEETAKKEAEKAATTTATPEADDEAW